MYISTQSSHHYLRLQDARFDLLMRQNHTPVTIHLVTHVHIFSKNRHVLNPGPLPNCRVPTNNTIRYARVFLDPNPTHHSTPRQPYTRIHNAAWPNCNIGPNQTSFTDLRTLMNQNVTHNV
ncbi:hypothetical protein Hanom_Chr07g00672931 [Helianthus anomalus]